MDQKSNVMFLLSLKCSKRFFLSLTPCLNCGNDKSLLPKYKILELEVHNRRNGKPSISCYNSEMDNLLHSYNGAMLQLRNGEPTAELQRG